LGIVWLAVLTDVGTFLLVILNSMLILQEKLKFAKKSTSSKYGTFLKDLTMSLLDNENNNIVNQGEDVAPLKFGNRFSG